MVEGAFLNMTKSPSDSLVPHFNHDCDSCRFLGHGPARILGDHPRGLDFYVCESGPSHRSMIARYGDRPDQYHSGVLFECTELTALDKVALFNMLELRDDENERLLRVLAAMWRSTLGVVNYEKLSAGNIVFGDGNVVWSD